ncbi:MAG TPA: 2TM domain-containing protein [Burkholderiaceae bacterium]|nr:2TM domain-containing protein [Burkholderiaceae bacterium]
MQHDFPRDSIEARALRRVRRRMGFYIHALVFVLVHLGAFVSYALTGHPSRPMFIWGWAVGLTIHGIFTFVSLQSEGLRERMLREEIERMRRDKKE